MTDILVTKIYNTFETYNQNITPFLSRVLNHVHGIENLDKTTLTDLLKQATRSHWGIPTKLWCQWLQLFKMLHPGQQFD